MYLWFMLQSFILYVYETYLANKLFNFAHTIYTLPFIKSAMAREALHCMNIFLPARLIAKT